MHGPSAKMRLRQAKQQGSLRSMVSRASVRPRLGEVAGGILDILVLLYEEKREWSCRKLYAKDTYMYIMHGWKLLVQLLPRNWRAFGRQAKTRCTQMAVVI